MVFRLICIKFLNISISDQNLLIQGNIIPGISKVLKRTQDPKCSIFQHYCHIKILMFWEFISSNVTNVMLFVFVYISVHCDIYFTDLLEKPIDDSEVDSIQHAKKLYTSCLNMSKLDGISWVHCHCVTK